MLKKWMIVPALAVSGSLLALPVAAQPEGSVIDMAAYFPAGTVAFGAIRTDDGYIDTLDTVIDRFENALPAMGSFSLRSSLDKIAEDSVDVDFETGIRPWLGDAVAFGLTSLDVMVDDDNGNETDSYLIAIQITDREGIVAFFDSLVNTEIVEKIETDTTTLYQPTGDDNFDPSLLITEGVAFIGNGAIDTLIESDGMMAETLASTPIFNDTLARLPEASYNAIGYVDLQQLLDFAVTAIEQQSEMGSMDTDTAAQLQATIDQFAQLRDAVGGAAFGATILDDRSFVIDAVQVVTDREAFQINGITVPTLTALDPAFAAFIPATTPAYIQFADLAGIIENSLASLEASAMMSGADSEAIEEGLKQVDFALRGLTGMDLEELTGWITGDVGIYFDLAPSVSDARSVMSLMSGSLPVDFAVVIDATENPEMAAETAEGLVSAIEFLQTQIPESNPTTIEISEDTIGDVAVSLVTIEANGLPYPIEIVIGANDQVLVIGTPRTARIAFEGGDTLADSALFAEATTYALENTNQFWYLAGAGIQPLINVLLEDESMGGSSERDLQQVKRLLDLLSTATITTAQDEDGSTLARAVITLSE